MHIKYLGVILSVALSASVHAEPVWLPVNMPTPLPSKWMIDANSGSMTKNTGFGDTSEIDYKVFVASSKKPKSGRIRVTANDCKSREGRLTYLNTKGYVEKADWFVFYAPTPSARLAATLCVAYDLMTENQTFKSAKDNPWIKVATLDKNTELWIGAHMVDLKEEDTDGIRVTASTMTVQAPNVESTQFGKISVAVRSCQRQQGEIILSHLDYTEPKAQSFNRKGSGALDLLADVLCVAAESLVRN